MTNTWTSDTLTISHARICYTRPCGAINGDGLTESQWRNLLACVKCPTLLLIAAAERDWTDTIRFCSAHEPLTTPVVVPGGHTALYDHFEAYAHEVLAFLNLPQATKP